MTSPIPMPVVPQHASRPFTAPQPFTPAPVPQPAFPQPVMQQPQQPFVQPPTIQQPGVESTSSDSSSRVRVGRSAIKGIFGLLAGVVAVIGWVIRKMMGDE